MEKENQSNNTVTNQLDVTPVYPVIREVQLISENRNATDDAKRAAVAEETVKIKVVRQGVDPITFIMKTSSEMKKLMQTYSKEAGFGDEGLRFLFDGKRIEDIDTPKSLELENGDVIEVFQRQTGGSVPNQN